MIQRDRLYTEIWREPMTKVSARHGVSSNYLARICKRLNIPRPPRGYWAKLAVGKAPPKPSLPAARAGDELSWSRGGMRNRAPRRVPRPPTASEVPRPIAIPRPRTLHPVVAGAREHFEGVRQTESGYLLPRKRRLVDLYVSTRTLNRALSLANRAFWALEARGHQVTLAPADQHLVRLGLDERRRGGRSRDGFGTWGPDRPTVVYVGSVAIGLTFFELSEPAEVRYVDGRYLLLREVPIEKRIGVFARGDLGHTQEMPSGKIGLRASSPYGVATWDRQWREDKKGDMASDLPGIVEALEAAAPVIAKLVEEGQQRAEQARRAWEQQREEWEEQERERQRALRVKESTDDLMAAISSWTFARNVQAFFEDAERHAESLLDADREAVLERVHRARELIGQVGALDRLLAWKAPDER